MSVILSQEKDGFDVPWSQCIEVSKSKRKTSPKQECQLMWFNSWVNGQELDEQSCQEVPIKNCQPIDQYS